ncbi:MAG: LiaI-LiaF-like domain-containing protein [Terriglobia bacterium]
MADREACDCGRCRCRGLMGPVVLITIGALFLIGEFVRGLDFGELWPVLLIVIGIMKLLEYSAPRAGHRG